jgi:NIMA (never in mitosis gene a)-related kinase
MPKSEALQAMTEIDIHGQLTQCPFTVKYHDSFISGAKVNIVMEFCPNGDLQEFLRRKRSLNRQLPESLVLKILLQICLGVLSVHDKMILHRDLKTQNIFLNKRNDICVGDFGLAR